MGEVSLVLGNSGHEFSLSQHAADLVAFVRDLGAGPVHLVAHSRGANVALRATVSAPEIVRSLVLAEGGGPMAGLADAGPGRRGAGGAVLRGIAEKIANGQTDAGLQAFIEFLNGPGAWDALPDLGRRVLRDNAATLPANEIDLARLPPLTCDEVRRLDVPVLLMGGTLSPPAFGAVLDRLQGCLSRFERVRIDGAGHGMARSHASVFDTAVMTFIDSRSPHGAR